MAQGQRVAPLELLTARGEVLVFEPLPEDADASLEGTTWAFSAFIEKKMIEEMACLNPVGVMEQEQRYLGFLEDVTVYSIVGNQLWLETGDGRALVFTAQE